MCTCTGMYHIFITPCYHRMPVAYLATPLNGAVQIPYTKHSFLWSASASTNPVDKTYLTQHIVNVYQHSTTVNVRFHSRAGCNILVLTRRDFAKNMNYKDTGYKTPAGPRLRSQNQDMQLAQRVRSYIPPSVAICSSTSSSQLLVHEQYADTSSVSLVGSCLTMA
jgi:hypothetical protein